MTETAIMARQPQRLRALERANKIRLARAELKRRITRAFAPGDVGDYLKRVRRAGSRIRDFESVLAKDLLQPPDEAGAEKAGRLYQALSVRDRAGIKEFYLLKAEEVGPEMRAKFQKLYGYY